jgi:hypothetical protein
MHSFRHNSEFRKRAKNTSPYSEGVRARIQHFEPNLQFSTKRPYGNGTPSEGGYRFCGEFG